MKSRSEFDRPLPHNLDAERAVLGACLLDSPNKGAALGLSRSDFFLSQHQHIFRCIKKLISTGRPVDLVLVNDELQVEGKLEEAGGPAYLAGLLDGVPRLTNVVHYADIVRKKAILRRFVYDADEAVGLALRADGNWKELRQKVEMLSAHVRVEIGQKQILRFSTGIELAASVESKVSWVWPGFVALGALTEVSARVKCGKTTLVMNLVRSALDGADFLEEQMLKTPVIYLTEQPPVSLVKSMEHAGLLERGDFYVLPFAEVIGIQWVEVAQAAIEQCKSRGASLLVVDTLPQFAGLVGDTENNSGDALLAIQPLQQAAAQGLAIIVVRHERKSGGEVGEAGRGSSAFSGAVDVVLSLRRPEGNFRRTVRLLQALSRFSETPPALLVELTDAGYISLGDPKEAAVREAKEAILKVAPQGESEALDIKELALGAQVTRSTAQRAVTELLADGKINKTGEGKKGRPFRYFVAEILSAQTSTIGRAE